MNRASRHTLANERGTECIDICALSKLDVVFLTPVAKVEALFAAEFSYLEAICGDYLSHGCRALVFESQSFCRGGMDHLTQLADRDHRNVESLKISRRIKLRLYGITPMKRARCAATQMAVCGQGACRV